MDDATSSLPDPGSCPCGPTLARLQSQLDALRAELAGEVRTHRVVVVDADGRERIRLLAGDGGPEITLTEVDGHERVRLAAAGEHGHVQVAGRTPDGPTMADLFALDAEVDDEVDRPTVGLELIDRGDTAATLSLTEGHDPHLWWLRDE